MYEVCFIRIEEEVGEMCTAGAHTNINCLLKNTSIKEKEICLSETMKLLPKGIQQTYYDRHVDKYIKAEVKKELLMNSITRCIHKNSSTRS